MPRPTNVLLTDMKRAGLNDSMLVRFILQQFSKQDFDDCDFAITMPDGRGGHLNFKFKVKLRVADWPHHAKTFCLKGHHGFLCCFWCCNCIGHCPYFEDPHLVHFRSTEYRKFIRHTHASIIALVDHLQYTKEHGSRQELLKEQQHTGYTYDPDGLMWDPHARSRLALPEAGYIDWMHVLVASGGIAQFQVNQVILILEEYGMEPSLIDKWCSSVKMPQGFTKLKKTFFADRVVKAKDAHIRAFAAEVLSAISLLGLFLDVVVAPMKLAGLDDHLACFTLLVCLVAILQKGDLKDIPNFRVGVHSHHTLFISLYPDCFKTKGHAFQHVADAWEFWQRLLACFSAERYHKLMKSVMKFSYRRCTRTTLAYACKRWFDGVIGVNAFEPVHFVGTVYAVIGAPAISLPTHGAATITNWSLKLRLPLGLIGAGDLVRYVGLNGENGFGIVVGFARLQLAAAILFVAAIDVCSPTRGEIPGLKYLQRAGRHALITSGQVSAAVPYADFGGMFVPAPHA